MKDWLAGARPRTLPAAVVPVAVGTAVAAVEQGGWDLPWWRAVVALVVAVALQIGTNFANDYSDGVRGTDDDRAGPLRLVASGRRTPRAVRRAALLSFLVAAGAGTALVVAVGWELVVVGAAAIAAGWFYTGGPRPYGYAGYGELFVFVFFGLVATVGTTYVLVERLAALAVAAAVPVGLLATALLVVNNLRDIRSDAAAGKRTLAVRIGPGRTRRLYLLLVWTSYVAAVAIAARHTGAVLALMSVGLTVAPVTAVVDRAKGRDLIPVLGATAQLQAAFGGLLAVGLALGV